MTRNKLVAYATVLIVIGIAIFLYWSRGYGKTSQLGYEFAQALYSACNQKDLNRVNKVESLIQEYFEKNEIQKNERRWLNSIIHLARKEKWDKAQKEARKLLDAQIEYGAKAPKPVHSHQSTADETRQ